MSLFVRPLPQTPKAAAILLVTILIPSSIVTAVGGEGAGMTFGIAFGFVMAVASNASNLASVASAVVAGALAAAATMASESPLGIALLMLVTAGLSALANQYSAGIMGLAPIVIVLFGAGPIDLPWWTGALWMVLGGLGGLLVTRVLEFRAEPRPMETGAAWRHAAVVGVLSATAMYWALVNGISHGYWVAVTIVVALRPLPEERRDTLEGRLLGTLLGALIALAATLLLPTWGTAIVAVICLYVMVVYAMGGSYFMQTLFLTPMLLLMASLGDDARGFELTAERVVFTLVGAAVVVVAALLLRRWDRYSAT